jgi:hypothetical protein
MDGKTFRKFFMVYKYRIHSGSTFLIVQGRFHHQVFFLLWLDLAAWRTHVKREGALGGEVEKLLIED